MMRAVLLASATVTNIRGLRAIICSSHDPAGAPRRLELPGADWLESVLARKQPAVAVQHALPMADLPLLTQQGEQVG